MPEIQELLQIKDLWDEQEARSLGTNQLALLRYRSNLLGADLVAEIPALNLNCLIRSRANRCEF